MIDHGQGPALGLLAGMLVAALAPGGMAADPPASAVESASEVAEVSETFPSHGKRVAVDRFAPKAQGRYPLVVVLHGAGGIGPGGTGSPLHEESFARLGCAGKATSFWSPTTSTAPPGRSSITQHGTPGFTRSGWRP